MIFRDRRRFNSSITHTVCGIRMEQRIERKTLSYEIILERRRRSRYRKERRSTLSEARLGQSRGRNDQRQFLFGRRRGSPGGATVRVQDANLRRGPVNESDPAPRASPFLGYY
jgi:hypothetical protein